MEWLTIAILALELREVDGPSVDAGRRTRLEARHLETHGFQLLRQLDHRRIASPPRRLLDTTANVNAPTQESTRRQHDPARTQDGPVSAHDAGHGPATKFHTTHGSLVKVQSGRCLQQRSHGSGVEPAITL
jgi:hypothetical protein